MTARIRYTDGRWQTIELDGKDISRDVEEIHVVAAPESRMHPSVTFTMRPGSVEIELDDIDGVVDVGQAQLWLAQALDDIDVDRFTAEAVTLERSEGVSPVEATLATLVRWLSNRALR